MKQFLFIISAFLLFSCNAKSEKTSQGAETSTTETGSNPEVKAVPTMIAFEGGTFTMGSNNGSPYEAPAHQVTVKAFKIDKSPVTVGEFEKFVKATSYVTDAEKFGDSGVYNYTIQNWELKKGAYWLYPLGKEAAKAEMNHPVTHVSWNDAQAYCQWAKKRLPTEAEWEFAARNGGKSTDIYSWGTSLKMNDKFMANVWQGENITATQGADGFKFTSPVGYYGETASGMTDMGGNVWNWCNDTFELYAGNNQTYEVSAQNKAMRGGSFFFDQSLEKSYTVSFRAPNSVETSLFNIGFRCASN